MQLDKFKDVNLVIDKANDQFIQKQFVSSGDVNGRTLTIQITNDGEIGAAKNTQVNLRWNNLANGITDLSAFELIDASKSIYRIEYPPNMLTPGDVKANIQIIQNEKVTHLRTFPITVQQLAGNDKGFVENAQYSALVKTLSDASKFRADIDTLADSKADWEDLNRAENNLDLLDQKKAEKTDLKTTNDNLESLARQKVDKGGAGQVTWGMLGQDARENISGGKVAVVGENSVGSDNVIDGSLLEKNLADKAVTSVKTDFLAGTKQYIDQSLFKQGVYYASINQKVVEQEDQSLQAYPPIQVIPGRNYYFTNFRGIFCWFVDLNHSVIKRLDPEMDRLNNYSIRCNERGYLLLSKRKSDTVLSQVFDTDEYSLMPESLEVYEPQYVAAKIDGLKVDAQNLLDKSISAAKTDFIFEKRQCCDPEDYYVDNYWGSEGGYIKKTDGVGLRAYKRIPIKKGEVYSVFSARLVFCWVSDIPGKIIHRFSTDDIVGDAGYEVEQDGFIYITGKLNESSPKVFNVSLDQLDTETMRLEFGESLNEFVNPRLPNYTVNANQTTFATSIFQLIDEEESNVGYYWGSIGERIILERSDELIAYNKIPVTAGKSYSIINVRGVFGWAVDQNLKIIERFSLVDGLQTFEWTASVNCYICLSRRVYDQPSKVFDTPLSNITFDPTGVEPGECAVQIPALLSQQNRNRVLTVAKDGSGQYSTLKEAIESIKYSNKDSQVTIRIMEGEYDLYEEFGGKSFIEEIESNPEKYDQQVGIRVPDGVNLVGVGNVVLKFMVPDSDAGIESAQRISVLNVALQHSTFENLTLEAQNTRYVVHDETNNVTHNIHRFYRNVKMIHHGNRSDLWPWCNAFGSGTGSGGYYEFVDCEFTSVRNPFGIHDNRNQKSNTIKLTNCSFFTEGSLAYTIDFNTVREGVENHFVTILNCHFDKAIQLSQLEQNKGHGSRFIVSGSGNTVVPYVNRNSDGPKKRINFTEETINLKNSSSEAISIGDPIKLSAPGRCEKTDRAADCYGIALEAIDTGNRGLVKYQGFLHVEDTPIETLVQGNLIGIVDGKLAVSNLDVIGYAIDEKNILLKF